MNQRFKVRSQRRQHQPKNWQRSSCQSLRRWAESCVCQRVLSSIHIATRVGSSSSCTLNSIEIVIAVESKHEVSDIYDNNCSIIGGTFQTGLVHQSYVWRRESDRLPHFGNIVFFTYYIPYTTWILLTMSLYCVTDLCHGKMFWTGGHWKKIKSFFVTQVHFSCLNFKNLTL